MNNKLLNSILFISLLMFSVACNPRKAQEKQADERLKIIEQLINENALNTAKFHIDSIHSLFPKLVEKRRIAAAFGDTITRRESARNLAYCDSILPLKQHEADSIQKKFRFEKDTVYQEFGNFVYKTQRTESNANRTYLKSYVDENANFFLISNYTGGKIEHISVLVSSNDLFAQTDSIETTHPNYHSFDDGGTHWETITFKNENDKGVASFISQYSSERIKVTLLGKKKYIYYLDESDKKAITETYNLWVVKRDISKLMDEIKKSKIRIERINQRKSKS